MRRFAPQRIRETAEVLDSGVIHEFEMRAELAAHAVHGRTGSESVGSDARHGTKLRRPREHIAHHRPNVGASVRTHANEGRGRNCPMSRIDDNAQRGKGKLVCGGNARDDVRFHVDRGRTGCLVQFALLRRLCDWLVNAYNRCVDGAGDLAEELARPRGIGSADGLRFAHRGSNDPISSTQVRGQSAGDAEADQAAVALPDGAVDDRCEFTPGGAANDKHPRAGSDASLEGETDEGDDDGPVMTLDSNVGDPKRVVGITNKSIYKSSTGIIKLGCH
jgi:hypothetical protein